MKINKVYIIDDNNDDIEIAKELLKEFEVESSNSIQNGYLDKIESFNPDIVLVDYRMPPGYGTKAIKEIREHNKDIPILLLTSMQSKEIVSLAIDAGANGVLIKDIDMEELPRKIKFFNK